MERLIPGRAAAGLGFLVGLVGLLGCASVDLEPPSLTLVDLRPAEATLFETTLSVKLRISNPNPEPLTFEGASFKLTLDGRKIGRGSTAETVTVNRLGSEVIEATFHISNASLLLRLKEILEVQTVAYAVTGKLYTQQSGRTRSLKVESSGQLDLSRNYAMPATPR
jgi:LEA14-like dessication related protein